MEAEALAEKLRSQLGTLRDAQSRQQRSSQERLSALQAHLQSLASRVVRLESHTDLMEIDRLHHVVYTCCPEHALICLGSSLLFQSKARYADRLSSLATLCALPAGSKHRSSESHG